MKDLQAGKKFCFLKRFPSQSHSQEGYQKTKRKIQIPEINQKRINKRLC